MREKNLVTVWNTLTPQDRHIIADCVAFEMSKLFEGKELWQAEELRLEAPTKSVTFRL